MKTIILTGKLGSGKTTNLKGLIKNMKQEVSVIINEMSTLGLDAEMIGKKSDVEQISGGCVCCSKSQDMIPIIDTIKKNKYLVVETTGISSLEPLVKNMLSAGKKVDGVVVVVDALSASKASFFADEARTQIEMASTVIISKSDLVSGDALKDLRQKIKKINEGAKIVVSINGNISLQDIKFFEKPLTLKEKQASVSKRLLTSFFPEIKSRHPGIGSVELKTSKQISKEKLISLLKQEKSIERAKGFVVFKNSGRFLFNYSSGRTDFESSPGKGTYLVLIGNFSVLKKLILRKKLEAL